MITKLSLLFEEIETVDFTVGKLLSILFLVQICLFSSVMSSILGVVNDLEKPGISKKIIYKKIRKQRVPKELNELKRYKNRIVKYDITFEV